MKPFLLRFAIITSKDNGGTGFTELSRAKSLEQL